MLASRLKVVPPLPDSEPGLRSSVGLPPLRHDTSPFQMLSEAVQSFEALRERCELAEALGARDAAAHAAAIEEANRTIEQQQNRIAYLETLLDEFKVGLRQLAQDTAQQTEDLKKSELARVELSQSLKAKKTEIEMLQQRCSATENETQAAQRHQQLAMEVIARHVDHLKQQEAQSAAEARAVRQAREDMERFIDSMPRSGRQL